MFKFLVYFLFVSYVSSESDQDMCKLCDKGQENEHIFCKFPNPGPPDTGSCGSVDKSITNDEFRKKVLDWHNDYRNQFAAGTWKDQKGRFPKAADMRALTYDCELEKLAMRNVQNCFYEHEKCRATKRFQYGQNLAYMANSAKSNIPADTQSSWEDWVGEMKDYKVNSPIENMDGSTGVVAHFVQATRASIRVIGCAQVTSKQKEWFRIDVACNYGPNDFSKFYTTGEPCSKCPQGTKCGADPRYPNLCAVGETSKTSIEEDIPHQRPCSAGNEIVPNMDFSILLILIIMMKLY